ncbi:MAG: hypothetical protein U1C46_09305 [Bacteroidales bacterium]|nr:hypothetical protein [Bacteroidales bacterium]MDZ4204999.1 hypothetical protein [Bacteroidales bacterium]
MKIRAHQIKSLKDIDLEKERIRYFLLRSEMEINEGVRDTREMLSLRYLKLLVKRSIMSYLNSLLYKLIR